MQQKPFQWTDEADRILRACAEAGRSADYAAKLIGRGCKRGHVYRRTRVLGDVAFRGGRRPKNSFLVAEIGDPGWQDFEVLHMDEAFTKAMQRAIKSGREFAPTEISREPGTKRPTFIQAGAMPRRSVFADCAEIGAQS